MVGSGVSGAHAALTLLERGHDVALWDVGQEEPVFPERGATFHELKSRLADPIAYFLGADLRALVPPASGELLRYPPSREFLIPPTTVIRARASSTGAPAACTSASWRQPSILRLQPRPARPRS